MGTHIKPIVLHAAHATGPNPVKIAMALEALHVPFDSRIGNCRRVLKRNAISSGSK
jgi:hypothetical protein